MEISIIQQHLKSPMSEKNSNYIKKIVILARIFSGKNYIPLIADENWTMYYKWNSLWRFIGNRGK